MMKQYLIKNTGRFYKANLHCHSTLSDGKLSPTELKEYYKAKGYSVLSITDHEILVAHPHLDDSDFLTIPGYEISVTEVSDKPYPHKKVCHMNLYPKDKNNLRQVYFSKEYVWGNAANNIDKTVFDESNTLKRTHTPECINKIVKEANKNGFLVTYNHPTWSLEDYSDYINYEGFFAMEIYNHSCANTGLSEYNDRVYDDMLRSGKKLHCVAADDNHNSHFGTPNDDSFGGFIMIKAESLTHEDIITALEEGEFYASTGPYIEDIYIEDNKVHIKCSDASRVCMLNSGRRAACIRASHGQYITEAVFNLPEEYETYFRIEVIDKNGRSAYTRAYYKAENGWQ